MLYICQASVSQVCQAVIVKNFVFLKHRNERGKLYQKKTVEGDVCHFCSRHKNDEHVDEIDRIKDWKVSEHTKQVLFTKDDCGPKSLMDEGIRVS